MGRFILTLSAIVLVLSSNSVFGGSDEEFNELMASLQHGDNCSWKAEERRQDFVRKLIDGTDIFGKIRLISGWKEYVLGNNVKFCSAVQLLTCDKETEKCICGDPGKRGGTDLPDSPDLYETEIVDDKITCRWPEGSSCAPEEYLKTSKLIAKYVDSKCAQKSHCTSVADGSRCTIEKILAYRMKNRWDQVQKFTKDIFDKKVCTCQQGYEVEGSSDDQKTVLSPFTSASSGRSKRDTKFWNMDMSIGGVILPAVNAF